MSLDIDIGEANFNLTYNYSFMYCMEDINQLRELDGMLAPRARIRLKWLRTSVEHNYFQFREKEGDACKGWGSVDGYYAVLNEMILACTKDPTAIVRVE